MQTREQYLARKREELELFVSALGRPFALPSLTSPAGVLELKSALRAELRTERESTQRDIWETNRSSTDTFALGNYRLNYRYQRFDLTILGPEPYPTLANPGVEAYESFYASSGMGALSALFFALARALCMSIDVLALKDTFFETQHLVRDFARLELRCFDSAQELAVELTKPRQKEAVVVLLDSMASDPGYEFVRKWQPGAVDLLIHDTTCLPQDSPVHQLLLEDSLRLGMPLALARSHLKLDGLGIEYGRLGSLALVRGQASRAHALLLEALRKLIRDATRTLGVAAQPSNLSPLCGEDVRVANARRVAQIRENTALAEKKLRSRIEPLGFFVRSFLHGLYFTIEPGPAAAYEDIERLARSLAQRWKDFELPITCATTFGLDCVTLSPFLDVPRNTWVLRVAMADHDTDLVLRFCDELAEWARDFPPLSAP